MARARSKSPAVRSRRKAKSPLKEEDALAEDPALRRTRSSSGKDLDVLTGDHGISPQEDLEEFIWSKDEEPHADRKRALVKKYPKIKELYGHDWRSKYIVLGLMALQFGSAWAFRDSAGSLSFFVFSYVVGATVAQALFLANHETSHNLAFKSFRLNKMWGIFTNLPLVLPYFISFKVYHNEHHKYQGIEGIDTDLPTKFEAWIIGKGVVGKAFWMFFQTWFYAFRPLFISEQRFTNWHLANVVVQLSFNWAMVYFLGWGPLLYLMASMQFAGGIHPMAAHFIAEHMTFAGEVETVSYYGPLNIFAWNVGYHNEHHDFPNISWANLPKLREVAYDEYSKMPYHKSWTAVLWKFLFDPNVSLYNRVKRDDKDDVSSKLPSAGGSGNVGLLVLLVVLIAVFTYDFVIGGSWGL